MICNELYDGQGLGNQLWNYAVARVIAHKKNSPFSILGREHFKGKEFLDIDFGVRLTGGYSPEGGPPWSLPKGIQRYYRERKEDLVSRANMDMSRTDPGLFAITLNTKFDGNCQSTKYLDGYKDHLRKWLKIKEGYGRQSLGENACIIHLRCGDFVGIKEVFLPVTYYEQAMEEMRKINEEMKFYCITDQKEIAKKILPGVEIVGSATMSQEDSLKASHHHGGPVGVDFTLLMNAKYLIIPNSSFSWWAAYLNPKVKKIIAPKYWARYNASDGLWSTADIITEGFTYIDKKGKTFSSDECWKEKEECERQRHNEFIPVEEEKRQMPGYGKIVRVLTKRGIMKLKIALLPIKRKFLSHR